MREAIQSGGLFWLEHGGVHPDPWMWAVAARVRVLAEP